ncbi:MAG: hypothetical protein FJZ01_18355 [Candidatus Sericytochromatia bacterium]|nr:hypothetical protein [Candidatus Tanganyikabacteria bacterium]
MASVKPGDNERGPRMLVNGNEVRPAQLVKIGAGNESAALAEVERNGADDIVFKMANDTYVASGRGLDLGAIIPGQQVVVDKQAGVVTRIDDQLNAAAEGGAIGGITGFVAAAGVVGVGALVVLGLGLNLYGLVLVAAAAIAVVPALLGGAPVVGAAVGSAWAAARKVDLGGMLRIGTALD